MKPIKYKPRNHTRLETLIRTCYVRVIIPVITDSIKRQRLKLAWYVWGYLPVLFLRAISFADRLKILWRFLKVDWNVLHGHLPSEMSILCRALVSRPARPREVVVEAGCWQGGSSTKLSI